jgi:hypothetical protein
MKTLQNTLKTLRAGGWFAAWLGQQVHNTATSDEADLKYPEPLRIMANLVDEIEQFKNRTENVRELVEMRPDLFAHPAAVPPALAPTKEPGTEDSKPQKRSHTKRTKKVNHAA